MLRVSDGSDSLYECYV